MQEFIYPEQNINPKIHKNIVNSLLKGSFITLGIDIYETILKYKRWYRLFFKHSFNIELKHNYEVFYLVNENNASTITKRILTTTAILMYELNNKGIEPIKAIRENVFKINIINNYISESVQFSSFYDKNRVDSNFINKLEKLGLIKKLDDNRFMFTGAIEVFLNEYDDIKNEVIVMNNEDKE